MPSSPPQTPWLHHLLTGVPGPVPLHIPGHTVRVEVAPTHEQDREEQPAHPDPSARGRNSTRPVVTSFTIQTCTYCFFKSPKKGTLRPKA